MNSRATARRAGPFGLPRSPRPIGRPTLQHGVTLIELLIALAITMIMMTAVVTLFANLTATVTDSRALIEISERMRAARNRLQLDLAGHTATTLPPLRPEDGEGYFEIVEGPNSDWASGMLGYGITGITPTNGVVNPLTGAVTTYYSGAPVNVAAAAGGAPTIIPPYQTAYPTLNSIMGDSDDILALTVRSQGEPFVGSINNGTVMLESPTAEVIWFALPNGRSLPTSDPLRPVQLYTLYRRVLLVNPTYFNSNYAAYASKTTTAIQWSAGLASDLSVYTPLITSTSPTVYNYTPMSTVTPGSALSLPNTLETLTQRENRYLHYVPGVTTTFPFPLVNPASATPYANLANSVLTGTRLGEDVILTDVLSFDIRVFDPMAQVKQATPPSTDVLVPSDPGYFAAYTAGNPTVGYGAYVDLGYNNPFNWGPTAPKPLISYFSAYPNAASNVMGSGTGASLTGPGSYFFTAMNYLPQTYDVWSQGYEQNNYDDDLNGITDQATDGLDDDTVINNTTSQPDGIVDNVPQIAPPYFYESGKGAAAATIAPSLGPPYSLGTLTASERETLPPYPFPLRGVQILIRVYEPDTRQVRQVTVTQDFLPD